MPRENQHALCSSQSFATWSAVAFVLCYPSCYGMEIPGFCFGMPHKAESSISLSGPRRSAPSFGADQIAMRVGKARLRGLRERCTSTRSVIDAQ